LPELLISLKAGVGAMLIWQLILIQVATFVLIVVFLRWLLSGHIGRALRRLQKLNQENLEKEKVLKDELERAKREAEREVEEGRREAEELKEQARNEAEKNRENILARARKEAKRLVNEAVRDCQRKGVEVTLEMQEKSVYLATDMIRYIFTERGREDLHIQLIDELIAQIQGLAREKLKAEGNQAEVICASPLKDRQRDKLKEIVSSKLDREIALSEKIDEDIVAGLIIKMGGFVIDGSIKNKLKKILPIMREKAKGEVP